MNTARMCYLLCTFLAVMAALSLGCTAQSAVGPVYPLPAQSWTAAENFAWECIRSGLEANFARLDTCSKLREPDDRRAGDRFAASCPALPSTVSPSDPLSKRVLSSRFLETIISDPTYQAQIGPTGIRIVGAVFLERLILENIEIKDNLVLDRSIFRKGIDLDGASAAFNISLDQAIICETLTLKRSNISGELFIRGGTTGSIEAVDATIGKGINADNASVLYLFWLDRAKIGRLFSATESLLSHVIARSTVFDGDVLFDHTRIRCRFALSGSTIDGNLALVSPTFGSVQRSNGERFYGWYIPFSKLKSLYKRRQFFRSAQYALKEANKRQSTCKRDIILDRMFVKGSICFNNILPRPNHPPLNTSPFVISMDITTVNNAFAIAWSRKDVSNNQWLITNTKFGWLYSDLQKWPSNYSLIDTVYQNLSLSSKSCGDFLNRPSQKEVNNAVDKRNTTAAPGIVLQWLADSHPRSTQPFVNAITALKSARFDTRDIEIALEDFKLQELTGWRYLTQLAYGALVSYGYRPLLILVWILGAVLLFWLIVTLYEDEKRIWFVQDGEERSVRLGFFYSLDNFIPYFKLNEDNYRIRLKSSFARRYLYFHKILGYIFSLFLLAGLSGLTV